MHRNRVSRRDFITRTAAASLALWGGARPTTAKSATQPWSLPIVVFSKVYQELKLGSADAAELTVEAGLAGVDCPLRPGGEVLPERVGEDLPRYAEELRRHQRQLALITSGITSVSTPHTEKVLQTTKQVGVRFYRLGFFRLEKDIPRQLRQIKAQLRDLAALNRQLGLTALFQNHSGGSYVGGDLGQLFEIVKEFTPEEIGVAFDIGHAVVVHGDGWRPYFEKLKSHLKIAYVKDVNRDGKWVPFGEGELARTGYFSLLKQLGYRAPISLHIEYAWVAQGEKPTRQALVKALQDSSGVLKQWLASA